VEGKGTEMSEPKQSKNEAQRKGNKAYMRPEILSTERLESVANVCGPAGSGAKTTAVAPDFCSTNILRS